ncbi:hypothetical protein [Halobacteriovorax sp. HLS]|uniref:hypothetical protein n=1 Tax=Halobacteriovorax sp. HLS TaxID=2234000 RepID=UPI000FD81694|nr:hypothetical protein [Halobacteriovorax sp. HLS]
MANSKKARVGELKNYFEESDLDKELQLSDNGQLKFHWANWNKSCLIQRENILNDSSKIELLEKGLEFLKSYPIWYQRNLETVKSNLYELYTSYLDPRLKMTWHTLQSNTQVSLHHESGPYISLTSMRWMDKETYSLFVFKKLLTSYFPLRDFRVSADIELTGEVDHCPLSRVDLRITQFSKKGIIIAINGHSFEKVTNCNDIKLPLNLESFAKIKNREDVLSFNASGDAHEQYINIHGSSIRRDGNLENASFSNGNEYFFFIPYSEIEVVGSSQNTHQLFGHFVEMLETIFESEISNDLFIPKAA